MTDRAWTITASRRILQDRWVSLRADECRTPSGVEIPAFYVLEEPDLAYVLALDREDWAILVRQYRHPLKDLSLELPGGAVDASDGGAVLAAARELREETGFTEGQFEHLVTLAWSAGRSTSRPHLVLARGVVPGAASPEPAEDIDVVRVPRSELAALAASGAIVNAPHVGMILLGLTRLSALEAGIATG